MAIVGFDLLGAPHPKFKKKQTIDLIPSGSAIGMFWEAFGDARPVIRQFAESGKFPAFRIQGWWSNQHKIAPIQHTIKFAKGMEKIAKEFPEITWYASPSCEHNEKNKVQVKQRMKIIRDHAPSCIPVNNPWQGKVLAGEINEKHGAGGKVAGSYINSWDGENCYDGDVNKYHQQHQGALLKMLWGGRFNGREIYNETEGEFPPPIPSRTAWPDRGYMQMMIRHAFPATPPPIIPGIEVIKAPWTYKLCAEDNANEEHVRENKPMAILPLQADKARLLTVNGQLIHEFKYFGPFSGGGFRYYSNTKWGWQLADKAREMSNTPWCILNVKNWNALVQPEYRWGTWR